MNVGVSESVAQQEAAAACIEEEVTGRQAIADEVFDQMKQFYADSLASIRSLAAKESDRLADELEVQKAAKLEKLRARLEKRKLGRANDIDSDDALDVAGDVINETYTEAVAAASTGLEPIAVERLIQNLEAQKIDAMRLLEERLREESSRKGGDLSLQEATQLVSGEYGSFYKSMLDSIKSTGDREASRLADELEAQRAAKTARLADRLAERRQREGQMTVSELDNLSREEVDAVVRIENEAVEKAQSIREKMLSMIKSEHETEAARLDSELRYKRDKQKADMKARIDKKVAVRAKELLDSSLTSGAPLEVSEAQALAEAEFKPSIEAEMRALNDTYKDDSLKDKMEIAAAIKDVHERELAKLRDLQSAAEANQRKCFQDRLAQKKKLKEVKDSQQASSTLNEGLSPTLFICS